MRAFWRHWRIIYGRTGSRAEQVTRPASRGAVDWAWAKASARIDAPLIDNASAHRPRVREPANPPEPAMDVYLNGQMIPETEARIAFDDAGFQHAVGLFETMHARHGRVFRLRRHLDRLVGSAQELGLARTLDTEGIAAAVHDTLAHNQLERARVRLTVTPGPLSQRQAQTPESPSPTVLVHPQPPTEYDPVYFERGITVLIAPPAANPFDALAGHKTLAYWGRLRTLRQAAAADAGEAIWLSVSNHLASGAVSNIFLVRDGELHTPIARGEEADGALPAPVLPGVTRAAVIEIAESLNVTVHKQMLSVEDLLGADEVFLTNSGWHLLPVTRIENASVGDGQVGELTQRLRHDLLELIERETASS